MKFYKYVLPCALLLTMGCDPDPTPVDAGDTDAGMMMVDAGGDVDSAVPMGDGNDSFAEADALTVGGDAVMARLGEPGDRDFYTFDGTAGQWMILSTEANPDGDPDMADTVITLYDSSMTMIAENDDSQPRFDTDSEIITRLPADGTYYVMVQEWSQWQNEMPFEGGSTYTYSLSVAALNLDAAAVTLDAEGGDDLASAQALGYAEDTSDFGILVGDFRDDSDVDVFSFSVPAGKESVRFMMMPSGADQYGSTTALNRMWITNADGSETISRINIAESDDPMVPRMTNMTPNLPAGDYNLFVENGGAPGANGFYVLKAWRFSTDNDPEATPDVNDDPTMAQALMFADDEGTDRGYIITRIGDGDTDHFSFDVTGTDRVSVFCGSATAGSGVQGLTAAIMDSTGATVIRMATETPPAAVSIDEYDTGAGSFLLRLTKTGQDSEVTGNWARCQVAVGPMTPPAP